MFAPLFTHAPLVSFLLMLQIVPYFMTGFESVSKAAEESTPEFGGGGFFSAIWMAIFVGILFYTVIIAAVAFVAPWHAFDRREIHDGGGLPASGRFALDCKHHSGGRLAFVVQMLQRKFRCGQPVAVCAGTAGNGGRTRGAKSTRNIKRLPPRYCALEWPRRCACCWEMRSWCR